MNKSNNKTGAVLNNRVIAKTATNISVVNNNATTNVRKRGEKDRNIDLIKFANKSSNMDLNYTDASNESKLKILKLLTDINKKLGRQDDTIIPTDLTILLFNEIISDQISIKERQRIISQYLNKYGEILENYGDKSITMEKLKELAEIIKDHSGQTIYR